MRTFASLALIAISATFASAAPVTQWSFDNLAIGVNNSPSIVLGTGTAIPLGLTNNLTTPASVTQADVLVNAGSSNPAASNQSWRLRGAGTGSGNGWAITAPQYTQGAQFSTSTAGFQNIVLTYDWSPTTQGVKHQQAQYSTDGSTWTNVGPLRVGPASEAWVNNLTVDMTSIAGVNDNPLFGVRIVSAFAPDGANAGSYNNLSGAIINGTSGNWRIDSILISGDVIPEPTTLGLIAAAGFVALRRRK